jgi:signal transduction histidine kinase
MKLLKKYPDVLLSFLLQVGCLGLITSLVFSGGRMADSVVIAGSLFTLIALSAAFHLRYVYMKQKLEKAMHAGSRLCHALRTPLTTVCGIAEIFEDMQDSLDPKQKELVRRLRSGTSALKTLVNSGEDNHA